MSNRAILKNFLRKRWFGRCARRCVGCPKMAQAPMPGMATLWFAHIKTTMMKSGRILTSRKGLCSPSFTSSDHVLGLVTNVL